MGKIAHQPKKPWWVSQIDLFTALAGLIVVTALVFGQPVSGSESAIFRWFNDWPSGWRPLFLVITQLGSAWALLILTIAVAVIKKSHALALRFLSVGVLTYGAAIVLKHFVARPRPYQQLADVVQRDPVGTADFGYPSGHAAMAIAAALLLLPLVPRTFRWVLTFLVALVGISRMYLGVHYPLDIVGGYFLGLFIVSLVEFEHKLLAKPSSKA